MLKLATFVKQLGLIYYYELNEPWNGSYHICLEHVIADWAVGSYSSASYFGLKSYGPKTKKSYFVVRPFQKGKNQRVYTANGSYTSITADTVEKAIGKLGYIIEQNELAGLETI